MQCVSQAGQTPTKNYLLYWDRPTNCPIDQVRNIPDTHCRCRKNQYFNGFSCQLCPDYCNDCNFLVSQITCIDRDKNRIDSGECVLGYFDEGYFCIKTTYKIIYSINTYQTMPVIGQQDSSQFYFFSHNLDWTSDKSFFLGFYANQIAHSGVNFEQVIAFIRDDVDVFVITISYLTIQQYYTLTLYYRNGQLSSFIINPSLVWIGIWSDFSNVLFLVRSQGQVLYDQKIVSGFGQFIDPIFCIGTCFLMNQNFGLYQGQLPNGLTFIKGLGNPYDRLQDLFLLQGDPAFCFAFFQVTTSRVRSIFTLNNIIQTYPPSSSIQLSISNSSIHIAKGIEFIYDSSAIVSPITFGKELSISMSIFFNGDFNLVDIFSYDMESITIKYKLQYEESSQRAYFWICIQSKLCEQTTKTYIKMNTPTFVLFIHRNLNPSSDKLFFYEIEVVSEKKREKISIHIPFTSQNYQKTSLLMKATSTLNFNIYYSIYFNNIRLFTGTDFYFDYSSNSNHCFISYNVPSLYCLKAKKGFATFQGKVILPENCLDYSSSTQAVVFNPYTQECLQLDHIIQRCLLYSEDFSTCLKCLDPNANLDNCFQCQSGFYKSESNSLCLGCSLKCLTCSYYDSCISCQNIQLIAPQCECPLNQFMNPQFECENCSEKCQSCFSAHECKSCIEGRINPPDCGCDPSLQDTNIIFNSNCRPIGCLGKCLTCEQQSNKCTQCLQGRRNPPKCECMTNYFEDGSICMPCNSHFYYDLTLNQCVKCDSKCLQCSRKSTSCTQCQNNLILVDSTCFCKDLSLFAISPQGEIQCFLKMKTSFSVEVENNKYTLIFTFDEIIDPFDFDQFLIESLLYVYLVSIPQNSYSLSNPQLDGKELKVDLQFEYSLIVTEGKISFQDIQPFKNQDLQKYLDYYYLDNPFTFKIGPLIIGNRQQAGLNSFSDLLNLLKKKDSFILSLLKQLLFIFYILNTLQPCIAFLMTKLIIPPNLYSYLQMIGLLGFKKIVDYGGQPQGFNEEILGVPLVEGQDYDQNDSQVFKNFYQSNNMILNISPLIIQIIWWPSLILIISIWNSIQIFQKYTKHVEKAQFIFVKILNSHIEVSLLFVTSAIFNQLLNIGSGQYLNRLSLYTSIILLVFLIIHNYIIFINLSIESVFNKGGFTSENSFLILVEKLNFENRPTIIRVYYFSQILKKYLLSVFLVFLERYPSLICAGNIGIFGLSLTMTLWIKPYKTKFNNFIKIGGEACLLSAWTIYLLKFVPFQTHFQNPGLIKEEDYSDFLNFGIAVIILLLIFNVSYLIEWILSLLLKIFNQVWQKKKQNDQESEVGTIDQESKEWEDKYYIRRMIFERNKK